MDIKGIIRSLIEKSISEASEFMSEQFNTEKGEAKEYDGKKYIGLNLMWSGKKFGEVNPHRSISQTKSRGSRIATHQKFVVRWGFSVPGVKLSTREVTNGFSSRDEAARAALDLYLKSMKESLDEVAIIKNGRKFSNARRFETDKEANDFLEKNPEYGMLHADAGGVYVTKNKNKGAPLK